MRDKIKTHCPPTGVRNVLNINGLRSNREPRFTGFRVNVAPRFPGLTRVFIEQMVYGMCAGQQVKRSEIA